MLDRNAVIGDDHPDLAIEDLQNRLAANERLVFEPDGALRIALPRRMKLRGGKSWTSFSGAPTDRLKMDTTLVDGLQRAHQLASNWSNDDRSEYRRRLRKLAFLAPSIQRAILEGRAACDLSLAEMLHAPPPLRWSEQRAWLNAVTTG